MDKRVQIDKRIKVYGYHGQADRAAELVQVYGIDRAVAMQAYGIGRAMARRGDPCFCSRCANLVHK